MDIEDVAKRLLRNLRGEDGEDDDGIRPLQTDTSILLAHDLTPSDTVSLDRTRIRDSPPNSAAPRRTPRSWPLPEHSGRRGAP